MQKYCIYLLFITSIILSSCSDHNSEPKVVIEPPPPTDSIAGIDPIYNDHGSKLVGVSTSSFSDANLTAAALQKFHPHFMRYYLGSTIVFDSTHAPNGIASVTSDYGRNGEWTAGVMTPNMNGWSYTPGLNFDEFIALCKATGAEPVVLLPVYAAYASTPAPKMTRDELYKAHKAFIRYANITKGYGVKYWEIGNEDDIDVDQTSAETYAEVFNEVVPILKTVDPTIECGANNFWNRDRWHKLLPLIKDNMDFAIIHQYSPYKTYDDFVTKDIQHMDSGSGIVDSEIMVDRFIEERGKLADSSIPSKVLVTEISSLNTGVFGPKDNCIWKGLHNIQLLLQYGSYPNVLGTMNWCTWFTGGLEYTFNVFSGSDETTLSPVGLTLKVINDHAYPIVDKNTKLNGNLVEVTITHTTDFSKMSIFILNKSKVKQTIALNINSFIGDPTKNTKSVYKPETVDEWSQSVTYKQSGTTDVSTVTGAAVEVAPLSCTVYDFN